MADGAEADISITFTQNLLKLSVIRQSIKRRIVSIAVGLIILMLATSVLSMVMVGRVGHLLDELTERYIPANASLTRINILTLERALALRRMVIAKMQEPPDESTFKSRKELYEAKDAEIDREVQVCCTSPSMPSSTTRARLRTIPRWRASMAGSTVC